MLRLRTKYGLKIKELGAKLNKEIIDKYISGGFLKLDGDALSATFEGMMILDKIVLELLP